MWLASTGVVFFSSPSRRQLPGIRRRSFQLDNPSRYQAVLWRCIVILFVLNHRKDLLSARSRSPCVVVTSAESTTLDCFLSASSKSCRTRGFRCCCARFANDNRDFEAMSNAKSAWCKPCNRYPTLFFPRPD